MNTIRAAVLQLQKAAAGLYIFYAIEKYGPRSSRDRQRQFWQFWIAR